jgi:hypothetical protein
MQKHVHGSSPSKVCRLGEHKRCQGSRGTGINRSHCTCRCHGARGFRLSTSVRIRFRGSWILEADSRMLMIHNTMMSVPDIAIELKLPVLAG